MGRPVRTALKSRRMAGETEKKIARRFVISGTVQGVGYRAFAERAARDIGLTGWVRNLADGNVEVHANGSAEQLDRLEGRLRIGPRWGNVRSVQASEAAVSDAVEFHIR